MCTFPKLSGCDEGQIQLLQAVLYDSFQADRVLHGVLHIFQHGLLPDHLFDLFLRIYVVRIRIEDLPACFVSVSIRWAFHAY